MTAHDPRLSRLPFPFSRGQTHVPRLPWWDALAVREREQDVIAGDDCPDAWVDAWSDAYAEAGEWTGVEAGE